MNKIKSLVVGLCAVSASAFAQEATTRLINLDSGWQFTEARQDKWQDATVPGTVHQDLLRLKELPDPFYRTNEEKIQWVEDRDWEYRKTLTVTAEELKYQGAMLEFKGLDTYADVYLNGSLIVKAENMFVAYEASVKDVLREGENRLHIYFYSPINKTLPQWESNGFDYPADNDHHDKHTSIFTRKAPYHYGWDWGIRMVGVGIWRPVELKLFNVAEIEDYLVKQNKISSDLASVTNVLEVNSIEKENTPAEVVFSCSLNGKEVLLDKKSVTLKPGINKVEADMNISKPELWMPVGWGNPTLYDFKAEVIAKDQIIASTSHRIGLRTVKVVNERDEHGKSYYFEVNGKPLFAKGSNYIPNDIILTNVTKETYDRLFRDVKEANMNMIRVWGGGIYEDDYFYQLADENGILVWQDFMFACTAYPSDPAFLKNVEEEADYNIKRLRNHPSIAMWCGNNEILEGIRYWGWENRLTEAQHKGMFNGYDKLFRELLPERVEELDPNRFYVHSSPDSANWGRPEGWGWGDSHYWGVWYGQQPFEVLDTNLPRFMSEFGFEAFPEMKVISTFAEPEDYALESEVMKAHQKSSTGNSIIRTYMDMYYHVPEDFEDFVYVGLVLQGQGMRHGFEAHRRNRPYTMGTLYWQLNDSWPVVSWSSIDYFGNWKALHYQAQRAFAPVFINAFEENGKLNYYLISDELEDRNNLTLETKLIDFNGKVLKKDSKKVNMPANTSTLVWSQDSASIVTQDQRNNTLMLLTLKDSKGKELNEQIFYFEKPKDLNLPETTITKKVKYKDGAYEVTLSSPKLARDVFVEIPIQGARFTDNFFDLLPGETKTIVITSPELKKDNKTEVKVKHLRETYK